MAIGEEVPGVVVAWGATLLTGAGFLAVLPPGLTAVLAWPGFLVSPVVALVVNWYGFDRLVVSAFAVAAVAVGVVCWGLIRLGVFDALFSRGAVLRLRGGLPLLVALVARSIARAIVARARS